MGEETGRAEMTALHEYRFTSRLGGAEEMKEVVNGGGQEGDEGTGPGISHRWKHREGDECCVSSAGRGRVLCLLCSHCSRACTQGDTIPNPPKATRV